MIGYLKGKVIVIDNDSIIVETNNIGYLLNVSLTNKYNINQEIILYIHSFIKEEQMILYGFESYEDKDIFISLLSVNGIGPKTALNILAYLDSKAIKEAIKSQDIKAFTRIPNVGPKASNNIINTLKRRFKQESIKTNTNINEAIDGLIGLGYTRNDISLIEDELNKEILTTKEYIKKALQLLIR